MADLTGSTIASSYDQLLAMPSGGGNGATLVALTDGNAGNTFALEVSTGEVKSTGTLTVSGITTMAGDLRLEDDAGGEYFGIGTPATVTTYTLTVPAAVGGSGQALRTSDGSGTLEWYTPETGDITGVTAGTGLSGGGTSGTVTLNVEASQTQITALGTIGTGVWQGTAVDGTYIDLEGTEVKSTGETGGTKFLREDGDGTCSWQAATATVTIDNTTIGSSTAGSVLFVNSSNQLSQDNDKLFWDATNFRLGIGTASPAENLSVVDLNTGGPTIDIGANANTGEAAGGIDWVNSYGVNNYHNARIDVEPVSATNSGDLRFHTASSGTLGERMRIDSSGNVGIGEDSPSYPLVVGGGGNTVLQIKAGSSSYSSIYFGDTDLGYIGIIQYNHADNSMEFFTGNSVGTSYVQALHIDNQQRVGIGRIPTQKLDQYVASGTNWHLTASGSNELFVGYHTSDGQSIQSSGELAFHTGGSFTEAMVIDGSQNVGIGVDSPVGKLDVRGNVWVLDDGGDPYIAIGDTTSSGAHGSLQWASSSDELRLNTSGTARVQIDSSGNVGIGATPTVPLMVESAPSGGLVKFVHTAGTTPDGSAVLEVRGNDTSDPGAYDLLNLNNAGTVRMLVQADGNVGIGTAVPDMKLHVSGTTGNNSRMRFTDTTHSTMFDVGVDGAGGFLSSIGANELLIYTDSTLAMRIDESQRVGIGGTPTSEKLEVIGGNAGGAIATEIYNSDNGDGSVAQLMLSAGALNQTCIVRANSGGADSGLGSYLDMVISNENANTSYGGIVFATSDSSGTLAERLTIDIEGNVVSSGSFTTTDDYAVHYFNKGNNTDKLGWILNRDTTDCQYAWADGMDLKFGTTTTSGTMTPHVTFDSSGLVGIGGTAVTKLTVEGAVTLKEQAAADSDTAAYGQIWVKTGTPNTLYFTDDAGTDFQLGTGGGSSGVTALSEAADVEIDFSGTKHQTLAYTGTCNELSTTGLSAGKEIELRIFSNDTSGMTDFTPSTLPAWKLLGTSLSGTGVAATTYGVLKLTSWGTTDADVTAELQITAY